jgi:hypothetical protein
MADSDFSSYILRYNLLSTQVEYFNGADFYPITALSGVNTLNGLSGSVVLAAGSNVTLTPSGNTITIASMSSGSGTVSSGTTTDLAVYTGSTIVSSTPVFSTANSGANGVIIGTVAGDDAAPGQVGEYMYDHFQNFVLTPINTYVDAASIILTPGDWDIAAQVVYNTTSLPNIIYFDLDINTVPGNSVPGRLVGTTTMASWFEVPANSNETSLTLARLRASITSTTTYYLKLSTNYTGSAPECSGMISARRMR